MKNESKKLKIKGIPFGVLLAGKVHDGTKTVTRRLTDIGLDGNRYDVAEWVVDSRFGDYVQLCTKDASGKVIAAAPIKPKFEVGQLLYVREPWRVDVQFDKPNGSAHIPDDAMVYWEGNDFPFGGRRRIARFMPARFARTFLRVTGIDCRRLLKCEECDAIDEGIRATINEKNGDGGWTYGDGKLFFDNAVDAFFHLWDSINGKDSHLQNPWVWVISFERVEMPNPWNSNQSKK